MTFKQLLKSITKKEWQWLIIISLSAIFIFHIPNIYNLIFNPPNLELSGIKFFTPADTNVYFSYINQIKAGNWTFHNQFSSETQNIETFNIFWLATGFLAKLFHLSATNIYSIIRIVLIPILITSSYLFISYFFSNKNKRLLSIILVTFGSGIGAYFNFMQKIVGEIYFKPLDLWMPEATFFNSFYTPHFILASALIIMSLLMFLIAIDNNKLKYSFLGGLLALILFNFHPYHLPIIYFVPFTYCLYLLISKTKPLQQLIKHCSLFCLVTLPSIVYHFYTMTDPMIGARAAQNVTLSPPYLYLALGLGIYLFLAILGIKRYFKNENKRSSSFMFLFIWICFVLLLYKFPIWQFQRRNVQVLLLPLVIFSVDYLFYLYQENKTIQKIFKKINYPIIIVIIFISIFTPTTFYNLSKDFYYSKNHHHLYYLHTEKLSTFETIKNLPPGTVLSSKPNSSFIVAHTDKTVFLGHNHEVLNSKAKDAIINQIFTNEKTDNEAYTVLTQANIKYLYWDYIEKNYYPNYKPTQKKYWRQINTNNDYLIFEIISP